MREPFLGEEVEGERDAYRRGDAARALTELGNMVIGVGVGRRREQLARKPEDALRLVHHHQLCNELFEIGEYFYLRQHLHFRNSHETAME